MRNINLGFFEKIYINLCCKKDLKNKRFCDFYTGLLFTQSRLPIEGENAELLANISCVQDTENSTSAFLVVSPFVTTELSQLIAKRDNVLAKKICIIKYSDNNIIKHRIFKFPDAIAFLDDQIRIMEWKIACLEEEYKADISAFQEKYDSNIAHGDLRLANACVKGVHMRREKYESAKKIKYDILIMLISEKIKIINVVNARIDVYKVWRFSRIRYYYSLASLWSMKLPVSVYSNKELSQIARQDLDQEYTGELELTKTMFNRLKSELSFLNESTIIEKNKSNIIGESISTSDEKVEEIVDEEIEAEDYNNTSDEMNEAIYNMSALNKVNDSDMLSEK